MLPHQPEIPICYVCQSPLRSEQNVRPSGCGHVICKDCAHDMRHYDCKCPMRCETSRGVNVTYETVYLEFVALDVAILSESMAKTDGYRATVSANDINAAEVQTIARLLCEVVRSAPETWGSKGASGNNKGLIFLRACRLLRKLGDGIQDNGVVKDFLHQVAVALEDVKNLCLVMADIIQGNASIREKLEDMNESLRQDLASVRQKLEQKVAWYSSKLTSERSQHKNRESQLLVDLNSMHEKWKDEGARRTTAEENAIKLEKELKSWRTRSASFKRKYEREKLENARLRKELAKLASFTHGLQIHPDDGTSDDSLEIEDQAPESEEDIELVNGDLINSPPPSTSFPSSSSSQPNSLHPSLYGELDGRESPPPLCSNQKKRNMERSQSSETLCLHIAEPSYSEAYPMSTQGSKHPISRTQSCSRIPSKEVRPSRSARSDQKSNRKSEDKELHSRAPVDPELLKICPELAEDISGKRLEGEKIKPNKPQSAQSLKPARVPINPFTTRMTSRSLRSPERKKKRLTMGTGDD